MKRILERKAICDLILFPDNDSARSKFAFFYFELTRIDVYDVIKSSQNSWQKSYFGPGVETTICCPVTTVDKRVRLSTMAMKIAVK